MHSDSGSRNPKECILHWGHKSQSFCERFQDPQFSRDDQFKHFYTGAYSDIVCITMNTPQPPKLVAIKRIRPVNQEDPAGFIRNELTIWSVLSSHAHVVSLLGLASMSELDDLWGKSLGPLAVCLYYEERSLKEFLPGRNLARKARLELLKGVIQGLAHIHASLVVHGDIKSANVAVATIEGQHVAKITDFGSSTLHCWCSPNPNEPAGTSMYDSPELFEDEPRTPESDMWAFGCVILEVYAGVYPFSGRAYPSNMHIAQITNLQAKGKLPGTDLDFDLTDKTSASVWRVTQQCWEPSPANRPLAVDLIKTMGNIHASAESDTNNINIGLSGVKSTSDQVLVHQYSYS